MRNIIHLCLLMFLAYTTQASDSCRFLLKHDAQITFHNAGIGMPKNLINGRFHPGIEAGFIQRLSNKPHKNAFEHGLFVGYMAQQALQRGVYLKTNLGYRINAYKSWWLKPGIQVSGMATYQRNAEFKLNAQGQYESVSRWRMQWPIGLGLETGVHVGFVYHRPLTLVGRYEFSMQYPFSQISRLLPINQIHVGLRAGAKK